MIHLLQQILFLPLKVVLSQVAILAQAVGVVRLGRMAARRRLFLLSFVVVAVVAHVFGVVPHVLMVANEKLTHSLWILLDFLQSFMSILQVKCLKLEGANRVLIKLLDLSAGDLRSLHWLVTALDLAVFVKFLYC